MEVVKRFSEFVKKRNLSSNSIARKCNCATSTINEYVRCNTKAPRLDIFIRFCKHYGVSPNWLFLGVGPEMMADAIKPQTQVNEHSNVVEGNRNSQVNDTTFNIGLNNTSTTINKDQSEVISKQQALIAELHNHIADLNRTIAKQADTNNQLTQHLLSSLK